MEQEPEVLNYETPEPEPEPPSRGWIGFLLEGLVRALLVVSLGVWAVVGAFFWVPLVLRKLIRFSFALVRSMLQGTRPDEAARHLRESVTFYRRGFALAIDTVVAGAEGEKEKGTVFRRGGGSPVDGLIGEMVWALGIWYVILLGLGWITFSPVDAWAWFESLPWGRWAGAVIEPLEGLFRGPPVDPAIPPDSVLR